MAVTGGDFTSETQLTTSEQTLVSTLSTERKFLGNVTLTNTSASNVEVTMWRVATTTTGTTGVGANWIFRKTIPAGDMVTAGKIPGHFLGPSMKLSGLASVTGVVNVDISGVTET